MLLALHFNTGQCVKLKVNSSINDLIVNTVKWKLENPFEVTVTLIDAQVGE